MPTPEGDKSRGSLLAQRRLAHHGILAGHSSTERTLDLGSESEFVEVIRLFGCWNESLRLERLVFKALQTVAEVGDVTDSGVARWQASGGAIGSG